jgi:hypothetical protein
MPNLRLAQTRTLVLLPGIGEVALIIIIIIMLPIKP